MTDDQPLLALEDVNVHFKEYDDGLFGSFSKPNLVRAVDGVSLELEEEEVFVILGESGCGKSTLGKTSIGLQRPTSGNVRFRGQDIWDAKDMKGDVDIPYTEIRHSLQHIHQDPGSSLNPNRTIKSILLEPLKNSNSDLSAAEMQERALTLLDYVGMTPPDDYIVRYPHQLSGGEQQRVAILRAFLMNPDLILADEAVSALDVSLRVEVMDLMLELQDLWGTSFIFISHNFSNARYLAGKSGGRIAIMYLGEIVEVGSAEEIIHDPKHPYTKALRWASPDVTPEETNDVDDIPVRNIDVPDPVNPPTGCRFHTRCPESREICARQEPELYDVHDQSQQTACFRVLDSHPYWDSDPIADGEQSESGEPIEG